MAPVIWGLDLKEIQWWKFKNSNMWNNEYHLRRTKFIVYQLALIFCVVSESLGTAALSGTPSQPQPTTETQTNHIPTTDYIDEQKKISAVSNHTAHQHNNDYIAAASYNTFAGVFVAFIFGAAFFFDLFWPERREIPGVRLAWRICGPLAVIFHLASALTLTVISARHEAFISGVPRSEWQGLVDQYPKGEEAPVVYRHNGRAIAAVCFAWPGFLAVLGRYVHVSILIKTASMKLMLKPPHSCILLYMSLAHNEKLGPKSTHARLRDEKADDHHDIEAGGEGSARINRTPAEHEKLPEHPAPIHQTDGPRDTPDPRIPIAAEHAAR